MQTSYFRASNSPRLIPVMFSRQHLHGGSGVAWGMRPARFVSSSSSAAPSATAGNTSTAAATAAARTGVWKKLVSTTRGRVYLGLGLAVLGVADWEVWTWYQGRRVDGVAGGGL